MHDHQVLEFTHGNREPLAMCDATSIVYKHRTPPVGQLKSDSSCGPKKKEAECDAMGHYIIDILPLTDDREHEFTHAVAYYHSWSFHVRCKGAKDI
jgi:hypothetical protein